MTAAKRVSRMIQNESLPDGKANETLAELVFNATALFLSISYGLLPLSLNTANVTVNSIAGFVILNIFVLLSGLAALLLSFFGIKKKNQSLINWGFACFLIMIALLTFVFIKSNLTAMSNNIQISYNSTK